MQSILINIFSKVKYAIIILMRALKEIGFKKAFKFFLFSLLQLFYKLLPLPQLRIFYLLMCGAKIGRDSIIMDVCFFNWHHMGFGGLSIGKKCFVGDEVLIDLYDKVELEESVTIAQRVTILTHMNVGYKDHPLQKYFPHHSLPVILKQGCVIGACSTILPGVTIGKESMVAAGSVVTKNVPPDTLVAGVPAKIIRNIK